MNPLSKTLSVLALLLALSGCAGGAIRPPVIEPPAAERYTKAFYTACMNAIKLFGKPIRLKLSAHDFCWCSADYSSRKFADRNELAIIEWTDTIAASERIGAYIVKELIKSHPPEILYACAGEPDARSKSQGRKTETIHHDQRS